MGTEVFLGMPPANIEQWIRDHHGPVVKETTVVKYTAASGLSDWEGDIVGQLTSGSIPNKSHIAEVVIGSHVTSIGNSAFGDCAGLTSLKLSNTLFSIGDEAFYYCERLLSIEVPDLVQSIGVRAFYNSSLKDAIIGIGVSSIGADAFKYCYDLSSVHFKGKTMVTVQGMDNYNWALPSGCVIHCTDGDITI